MWQLVTVLRRVDRVLVLPTDGIQSQVDTEPPGVGSQDHRGSILTVLLGLPDVYPSSGLKRMSPSNLISFPEVEAAASLRLVTQAGLLVMCSDAAESNLGLLVGR